MTDLASTLWFRRFRPSTGARVQLVCLPHAGGSASFYAPLDPGPGVDTVTVQYPGRQDRRHEPPVDRLDDLAAEVAAQILASATRPVAVFGHSLGAALGYEVARLLTAAGRAPVALIVSGRRAPHRPAVERDHLLDDAGLVRKLRSLDGTDARLFDDEEVIRMILPALRADYRAVGTHEHRPGPPLPCPITVLTGRDDPYVGPADAAAWQEHTSGGFTLRTFSGGHFYLIDHAAEVTDAIRVALSGRS